MNRRRNPIFLFLIGGVLLVCMILILTINERGNLSVPSALAVDPKRMPDTANYSVIEIPTAAITPTLQIINRRHILAGKSPEEIGQWSVQHWAPVFLAPQGPVEILLARPITREDLTELGLGCLPNMIPIEEPPYILVILEGNFIRKGLGGRFQDARARFPYAAFVIDVWSSAPTGIFSSGNGGIFRAALNDPTVPEPDPDTFPTTCPPNIYSVVPHGAVMPGIAFPTSLTEPTPAFTPPVPTPVSTAPIPSVTVRIP